MDEERKDSAPAEESTEEGEPEDGHEEGQHAEEPRAQAEPPRREGGGWLSKLIWLIILALIVWGGWTAYKRGNAFEERMYEMTAGKELH